MATGLVYILYVPSFHIPSRSIAFSYEAYQGTNDDSSPKLVAIMNYRLLFSLKRMEKAIRVDYDTWLLDLNNGD